MPPKKRLPRKTQAAAGEMNLEEAAAERIDAVTAESLHPTKFVEIRSPDGTLRLFYNTSTLIRIATDRGMFMQPPHFREPMLAALQKQVESIEGRTFHFEKRNVFLNSDGPTDGGVHVLHRHVYFDQIMDEFYLLNPAELYVCPSCYLHWVTTRFVAHLTASRQRIEYMDGDADPVVDPLDVLAHMQGVQRPSMQPQDDFNETMQEGHADMEQMPLTIPSTDEIPEWDSPLVHIVFRRAVHWKQHVRQHHQDTSTAAGDYRLRDLLCQYFARYNRLFEEKYRKQQTRDGGISGRPELTLTRYWHINARYNRLRYNRIVEAVERAGPYIRECVDRMAFENEQVTNTFNFKDSFGSESDDFICDDTESSEDSDDAKRPRRKASSSLESEKEENVEKDVRNVRGGRKRRREAAQSSTTSSSQSQEEGEDETTTDTESTRSQSPPYKRGLLAPLPDPYRKLSYEERCVLDSYSRKVFKPSVLYTPRAAKGNAEAGEQEGAEEEEIDWNEIGETLEDSARYTQSRRQRETEANKVTNSEHVCTTNSASEKANERGNSAVKISPSFARAGLLMEDEADVPSQGTRPASVNKVLMMDDSDS